MPIKFERGKIEELSRYHLHLQRRPIICEKNFDTLKGKILFIMGFITH